MLLLIPGPVTTHPAVREAACADFAPWDLEFRDIVAGLRASVLRIAGGRAGEHVALPLPGCGHFAMEAAVRAFVPPGGRFLLPLTGQYADRIRQLAVSAGREPVVMAVPHGERVDPLALRAALDADGTLSHAVLVYSETSTGVVHDVPALARAAGEAGRRVVVDAVSAFGAMPLDMGALPSVDSVAFTSNKCLEGLPGLSFTVARVDALERAEGRAGSWSLDLHDVWRTFGRAGEGTSRFTPPAQAMVALARAVELFDAEGGQPARLRRYTANMRALCDGVGRFGLRPMLPPGRQGPIVVNIHAPDDPAWHLQAFVDALKARGVLISNFHNTAAPSFRVGCIGAVSPEEMAGAADAMGAALADIGVRARQAA